MEHEYCWYWLKATALPIPSLEMEREGGKEEREGGRRGREGGEGGREEREGGI